MIVFPQEKKRTTLFRPDIIPIVKRVGAALRPEAGIGLPVDSFFREKISIGPYEFTANCGIKEYFPEGNGLLPQGPSRLIYWLWNDDVEIQFGITLDGAKNQQPTYKYVYLDFYGDLADEWATTLILLCSA